MGKISPGDHMTKRILFLACALLLGGCAIPVPLQIASWAVDGLIFITTEKTVSDHGISLALRRDCAMLRVLTEGDLCRDGDPVVEVAALMPPPNFEGNAPIDDAIMAVDGAVVASAEVENDDIAERLAAFETAAGAFATAAKEVSDTAMLEQKWQDWTEAPFEEAFLVETTDAAAHWQAIIDSPSDLEQPGDRINLESLAKFPPEPNPEPTAELAENAWASTHVDAPGMIGELLDFIRGDDALYFGDTSHDPVLSGNDAITILGGAGNDLLTDEIGDTRSPARTQAFVGSFEWEYLSRKLPPPGNASARGRSPPGKGEEASPRSVFGGGGGDSVKKLGLAFIGPAPRMLLREGRNENSVLTAASHIPD